MGMVATPSPRDFQGMVRLNMLKDCPITNADTTNANTIFGTDLATIRGKTVRRRPKRVITDYVNIPRELVEVNQRVTLAADVMFVNSVPFLVSVSRNINLITIEHAPSPRTATSLGSLLQRIVRVYARAGFTVQSILMDNEFEKVRDHVPMLDVNTTAASEHVGDIERRVRLIKERARGIVCTLPYTRLPRIMLIHLMHFITMWLNNFPVTNGVSADFSPREIILRHRLSYKYHCRAPFGAYCETHEDNEPTNSMRSRALPTICLGPTGNFQGTYHFLNLLTGLVVKRRAFVELPAPQSVIDRVAKLATTSGVPRELIFANRNRIPFSWSTPEDNGPTDATPAPVALYPDLPAELPGVLLQRHLHPSPAGVTPAPPSHPDWTQLADEAAENADLDFTEVLPPLPEVVEVNDEDILHVPMVQPTNAITERQCAPSCIPKIEHSSVSSAPLLPLQQSSRYPTRTRRPPQHLNDYLFTTVAEEQALPTERPYHTAGGTNVDLAIQDEHRMAHVCHYVMTHVADSIYYADALLKSKPTQKQYSLKAGLRRFHDRGNEAVVKELTQFHTLKCFRPRDPSTLSREDRRNALTSLMFLTEKRSGEIKARACANGSTQRSHIAKDEATAPTVTSEAIFIQSTIFAHEGRDIATCDIPGAFLQADNPDYVLMRLDGILAELMVQVAPSLYRKYVTTNTKGKAVLYVQLEKAVYGMMKSALLFYRKLVADLTSLGYTINPYDPCVANKIINDKQMTICWHVDDLLIGHVDSSVVTTFLQWLASRYDTADKKLNVTRGPRHDYLGMNIDFSDPGSVAFDMIPYISKILTGFPEKITGVSSTPAADHLFTVRPHHEASFLPEEQARSFHHTTAQLLFLSRVRRDIQPTIAFLTTRVKQPDEDDWGKLKRLLKYLNSTRKLRLTLFADSLTALHWYIDASHQTHDDCKGHTGSILTFGKGATTSSSTKHKIPSKSSTESEIIGLYDKTGDILWTRHFLEAQGYTITDNVVFQDNMSTLSLAKNGYVSSSKRTKHIKAKYFFIRHYHNSHELDLRYCPTELMWADILTKPLQGAKFRLLRALLMNCQVDYCEEPTFNPSPLPTLAPTPTVSPTKPLSPSILSLNKSLSPMKPRVSSTTPSSRGCVGTKGVKPTEAHMRTSTHPTEAPTRAPTPHKKVSWRDALFQRQPLVDVDSPRSLQSTPRSLHP